MKTCAELTVHASVGKKFMEQEADGQQGVFGKTRMRAPRRVQEKLEVHDSKSEEEGGASETEQASVQERRMRQERKKLCEAITGNENDTQLCEAITGNENDTQITELCTEKRADTK